MSKKFRLPGHHSTTIARNQHGIFYVQTDTETELYRAMGYCHAIDRTTATKQAKGQTNWLELAKN